MLQDKAENLKMKLKSVNKLKIRKAREEFALRNTERFLSEELCTIQAEIESTFHQLEDHKEEISKTQCQISIIGICEASEKCKFEKHIANITNHKNGYEQLFSKENEAMEFNKMEIRTKEAQEKELDRQKEKAIEETNQLHLKEAVEIEKECDAFEQGCAVLKVRMRGLWPLVPQNALKSERKRNKAIMMKLGRRLIESEELRRNLMRTVESLECKE